MQWYPKTIRNTAEEQTKLSGGERFFMLACRMNKYICERGGRRLASKKTRVSGCCLGRKKPYTQKATDGSYTVCIEDIKKETGRYLSGAEESGVYSVAGLCIELNITRQTLDAWRDGYYAAEDVHDECVTRNEELAECIEMVLLHIERFWEECDKSAVQSKHLKMLERSGAFEPKASKGIGTPPFDLGSLGKLAK